MIYTSDIGHRRCFLYFVSWRVNSKISLQNFRKTIVSEYSDYFGFLKVGATCLNQWQTIAIKHPNRHSTSNYVDWRSILCWYVKDQISTNFHVISIYYFDVVSLIEKSVNEKSTLLPLTLFDVISMVEKSTLFPRTFFNVIL